MELQGPVHKYLPLIKCLHVMRITKTRTTSFSELMAVKIWDNKYYTGYILAAVLLDKLTGKRSKQLSYEIYYINKLNNLIST